MSTFSLPDLGEGLQEAEIVACLVSVGDHVVADQPVLNVETDKAVVDIPAPQAGRVSALHVKPGDVVAIGAPLLDISPISGDEDTGTVVGELPDAQHEVESSTKRWTRDDISADPGIKASPSVRALARRLEVDLAGVQGSGPAGTITRADVEKAPATTQAAATSLPVEPLRGVRRVMARNMSESHAQVVPATLTEVADIDDWEPDTSITFRLIRAVCIACEKEPSLNAWFLGLDEGRQLHSKVDLGIATDTPDGLFVPVLRDAGNRLPEDLQQGLARMTADVHARTVPRAELRGATITLSNFGMLGGQHAALVVLPPQVAIVGVGRAQQRATVWQGQLAIRNALPLSLTFDHRAVVGAEAARFMAEMVRDLAKPA